MFHLEFSLKPYKKVLSVSSVPCLLCTNNALSTQHYIINESHFYCVKAQTLHLWNSLQVKISKKKSYSVIIYFVRMLENIKCLDTGIITEPLLLMSVPVSFSELLPLISVKVRSQDNQMWAAVWCAYQSRGGPDWWRILSLGSVVIVVVICYILNTVSIPAP